MIQTHDSRVSSSSLPTLTHDHAKRWATDGWLMMPEALSPAVRRALPGWVDDVANDPQPRDRRLHYFEKTSSGKAICRTERFIEDHANLHQLITQGVLPAIASLLLGEPAYLYKEKVNYKQPGGAGFSAHQDATAYAFVRHHVTCMVAVDPMRSDNGCLEFAPHPEQSLLPQDGDGCIAPEVVRGLAWQPLEVPAGGVVFFSSYTPHRSAANHSDTPRRALYLTYNAASEGDRRAAYYEERDRTLAVTRSTGDTARISTIGHFQGQNVR